MPDTIFLHGLEARGIIGIEDWERKQPQTIRVDVEMACDAARVAATDDLAGAVNYRAVAKAILTYVESHAPRLVETLAERLAELILRDFAVGWVRMRVSKPGAIRFSENVGVEIERGRRVP